MNLIGRGAGGGALLEDLPDTILIYILGFIDNPLTCVYLTFTNKHFLVLHESAQYRFRISSGIKLPGNYWMSRNAKRLQRVDVNITDGHAAPLEWLKANAQHITSVQVSCQGRPPSETRTIRKVLHSLSIPAKFKNEPISSFLLDEIYEWLSTYAPRVVALLRSTSGMNEDRFQAMNHFSILGDYCVDVDRDHYAEASFAWSLDPLYLHSLELTFHFWNQDYGRCNVNIEARKSNNYLVYRTGSEDANCKDFFDTASRLFTDLAEHANELEQNGYSTDSDDSSDENEEKDENENKEEDENEEEDTSAGGGAD